MKKIEDRTRKRRDYLFRKARANTLAYGVGCATVCLTLFAAAIGIPLLFFTVGVAVYGGDGRLATVVFGLFVLLALVSGAAYCGSRLYQQCDRNARFIPYVPPVREQIADLPADEVLLRGADLPTAAVGELLRPAREGEVTASEELLRAEQTAG